MPIDEIMDSNNATLDRKSHVPLSKPSHMLQSPCSSTPSQHSIQNCNSGWWT